MDNKIDVNITFDENNQIRVLSADKYRDTENLKGECIDFLKSKRPNLILEIMNFNEMVSTLIEVLDSQAQKIEDAKLKVIELVNESKRPLVQGTGLKERRTTGGRGSRSLRP